MKGNAFVPESVHAHLDSPEGNARREVRRKSPLILYDAHTQKNNLDMEQMKTMPEKRLGNSVVQNTLAKMLQCSRVRT